MFSRIVIVLIWVTSIQCAQYVVRSAGIAGSLDYRLYFVNEGEEVISPFHDIPLNNGSVFNMVVEIPRWHNAKFEINKETQFNPIVQDRSNQSLRFAYNIFPYKGYLWNYGAFPQTWEDPNHITQGLDTRGDNDPIDVIEIGDRVAILGEVLQVKILGIIALIDQQKTDWKVVVVDINDPLATKLHDVGDVNIYKPGLLNATATWFCVYKTPDGQEPNMIAYNGQIRNKTFATNIVMETHQYWNALINGTTPRKNIETINVSVDGSPYRVPPNVTLATGLIQDPHPVPASVDKWYYL
ncbi:Inorganic pyrophosphatase [Apophysomyces ossiformis]|uniref:inorganic diphosphatase n=1 Tax=Apophysomyces ossiformis TaxID=679940 RepID=A0A8H7BGH0_9FUNG|nr:Inorganic pyrophosphatase [Apophysomyces ossiformis]